MSYSKRNSILPMQSSFCRTKSFLGQVYFQFYLQVKKCQGIQIKNALNLIENMFLDN